MKRSALLAMLLTMSATAGCVERRFVIETNPPGALVYHNGNYLGATRADGYIIYYGKHQFKLIKEGYETLDVVQPYPPPWYEWPGLDFIAENIVPFKIRDVRRFSYTMRPLTVTSPEEVHLRAEQLRSRGKTIGPPRPMPPAPPGPPPQPPPGVILEGPNPAGTLPPPRPMPGPPSNVSGP